MATYKEYKPGTYTESDRLKGLNSQADYWNKQNLQDFTYDDFKESDRTTGYQNQLDNLKGPGDFSFSKQQGWDNIINQILNREKFSYDVNGDALYQQYKDQYVNQGKMAMMDTMGQAAAMTGGYGNSYAQSVGQQAYQGYLQQLTDKIPELYQMALDKYNSEGEELYNRYGLYSDMHDTEYGQHRDAVADYQTNRNYLADMWSKSHAMDMDKYTTNRDTALAENESYNKNITDNRNYYADLAAELANREWGQYTDKEAVAQAAINMFNDNLYRNVQEQQAADELAEKQRQFNIENDVTGTDDPGDEGDDNTPQFTGVSYNQAVAFLNKNGGNANGLIPAKEFRMAQGAGSTLGGKSLKNMTYGEYLKAYCDYSLN